MNRAAMALVALTCAPGIAKAQKSCEDFNQNVLMLSRVAVSEGGWDSPADHAAIYEVLMDVRRRYRRKYKRCVSFAEAAMLYSSRATGKRKPLRSRQRWVSSLDLTMQKPETWPEHLSWPLYKRRWARVVKFSRQVLRGEKTSQCRRRPHHWGAGDDLYRAARAGWQEVDCGFTKNTFFRRRLSRKSPSDRRVRSLFSTANATKP